ncbi:MAG: pyridoxal phosphate-dependent aminotransferase [Hyphomicrobiales bacterium]|nr:pyridoxal phosphate-dependent aminotransferase [Hyphomicrobiales bacterium]
MPQLSPILDRFKPSAIAGIMGIAARMRAKGLKLYDFSTGEPDFDTPDHIKRAAIEALSRGETKYSPTDGSIAVRQAVQRKFARDNSLDFSLQQVIVASGAKPLLADIIRTLASEGDEVVLARPCWTSHIGMIQLVGAKPVYVTTAQAQGFKMNSGSLADVLSPRTRAVVLCSPSNPSGAVYSEAELSTIADVLRTRPDVWIVTDDLYEHIVFDGRKFCTILNVAPDLADRTVVVNGVSKAYAMTGWRIGYAAGPQVLMDAVRKVMSQSTGCPSSLSEAAAIAALDGPLDSVRSFCSAYQARRDRVVRALNQFPGITCIPPEGAFYLYPSCQGAIGTMTPKGERIGSSTDFARYLLEDWTVAIVPGAAFEFDPHFRISIATTDADLDEGMARIGRAISALSRQG